MQNLRVHAEVISIGVWPINGQYLFSSFLITLSRRLKYSRNDFVQTSFYT